MSELRRVKLTDENYADITADNPLPVEVQQSGAADANNSTETPLLADGVFTGASTEILNYAGLTLLVHADVASATDGMVIQFSSDDVDWHDGEAYTINAGSTKFFTPPVQARYYRVVYTNGGSAQSEFHLYATLKKYPIKWSSHNINEAINDEDDAELVKSVITGTDGTTFRNVAVTQDGNLAISDNSDGLSIAKGDVTGTTFIHKFGNAPDFDAGDGIVDIWDGANDANVNGMQYTYSVTADIDSIVSSDNGDTQDIEIQGLDASYNTVTQTITLTGQTRAALTTPLVRVFRMINRGSVDLAGDAYCYVDSTITAGVPNDGTKVRAIIQNGNNQTLMALYTIPNGKTGYLREWYSSTAGANKTADYEIRLAARPFGEVFQLKHIASVSDGGTTYVEHKYVEPVAFEAKTDIAMKVNCLTGGTTGISFSSGFDIILIDN